MAQAVEHLHSKFKALSSTPGLPKNNPFLKKLGVVVYACNLTQEAKAEEGLSLGLQDQFFFFLWVGMGYELRCSQSRRSTT
jgi:hypothetical protein